MSLLTRKLKTDFEDKRKLCSDELRAATQMNMDFDFDFETYPDELVPKFSAHELMNESIYKAVFALKGKSMSDDKMVRDAILDQVKKIMFHYTPQNKEWTLSDGIFHVYSGLGLHGSEGDIPEKIKSTLLKSLK